MIWAAIHIITVPGPNYFFSSQMTELLKYSSLEVI